MTLSLGIEPCATSFSESSTFRFEGGGGRGGGGGGGGKRKDPGNKVGTRAAIVKG